MKRDFNFPIIADADPNNIDFYISRLMACSDALIAINERRPEFTEAQYEARTKEMLCVYMLMDMIEGLIKDMRSTNKCFKHTTEEGRRAVMEILPDYITSEYITKNAPK